MRFNYVFVSLFQYFNFCGSDRIRTYFVYPEGTVLQTVVTPPSSAALPNYFKKLHINTIKNRAKLFSSPGEIWTHTEQVLNLLTLPIGLQGHILNFYKVDKKFKNFEHIVGFEPTKEGFADLWFRPLAHMCILVESERFELSLLVYQTNSLQPFSWRLHNFAGREGFEPSEFLNSAVLETVALNHSATDLYFFYIFI